MGFFGKLFGGGGPRKPPSWARGFAGDGARFDAFCAVVCEVLDAHEVPYRDTDVRTGSVMVDRGATYPSEWIFQGTATVCAGRPAEEWRAIVEKSFEADGVLDEELDHERGAPGAGAGAGKAWIIGTSTWGGVMLECGPADALLVLLPTREPVPEAAIPDEVADLVAAIVVCNAGDEGHLQASAIARSLGRRHVYAIDPARPIDRGGAPSAGDVAADDVVVAEPLPPDTEVGALRLRVRGGAVHGTWDNGQTILVGDVIPISDLGKSGAEIVVGMLTKETGDDPLWLLGAVGRVRRIVLASQVPGLNAGQLAQALATLGLPVELADGGLASDAQSAPAAQPAPGPSVAARRMEVLARLTVGDLDGADAIAAEGIAAALPGSDVDDVDGLRHQRAMIALMRGDEPAALGHLEAIGTAQATISRAQILARQGDPAARALATDALARLPGDAITIRGAVLVHALTGDRAGARAILAEHGASLRAEVRAGLELAIDRAEGEPARFGAHRFPEHAQLVLDAVRPMIDAGRLAEAEPLLRRAHGWDPENIGITAELGYALARSKRDADAIALYDEAIAAGGSAILLRFNRGNCRLRIGAFAGAVEDFAACVAVKADWHDARVNLISAHTAAGDRAAARAELETLRARGGNPAHVAQLEKMLA